MKQEDNKSRSRNRVRFSTRGLAAVALGVLFSTSSVAFAADSLAWDKVDEVKAALRNYPNEAREMQLPSAPDQWICVHDDPFRPQPRLALCLAAEPAFRLKRNVHGKRQQRPQHVDGAP